MAENRASRELARPVQRLGRNANLSEDVMEIIAFRRILSLAVAVVATSCLVLASAPPVQIGTPSVIVQHLA